MDFPKRRLRVTQLKRLSEKSVAFTIRISPDLSTYSPFLAERNPAFPTLMYIPMTDLFSIDFASYE